MQRISLRCNSSARLDQGSEPVKAAAELGESPVLVDEQSLRFVSGGLVSADAGALLGDRGRVVPCPIIVNTG